MKASTQKPSENVTRFFNMKRTYIPRPWVWSSGSTFRLLASLFCVGHSSSTEEPQKKGAYLYRIMRLFPLDFGIGRRCKRHRYLSTVPQTRKRRRKQRLVRLSRVPRQHMSGYGIQFGFFGLSVVFLDGACACACSGVQFCSSEREGSSAR